MFWISSIILPKHGFVNEFAPIRSRKYEILSVEVGEDVMQSVLSALPEDCADDCYRIILTGESDAIDADGLQEALAHRFFSLTIQNQTTAKQELWSCEADDTLRGQFLRELKTNFNQADTDEQEDIVRAARLVLALMDGREVAP